MFCGKVTDILFIDYSLFLFFKIFLRTQVLFVGTLISLLNSVCMEMDGLRFS